MSMAPALNAHLWACRQVAASLHQAAPLGKLGFRVLLVPRAQRVNSCPAQPGRVYKHTIKTHQKNCETNIKNGTQPGTRRSSIHR